MDTLTRKQRSQNMAAIRARGNKTTEIEFAKQLRKNKISGWRRHQKGAYGAPDFLFSKAKLAVFVDGCFWHGCRKHCVMPKSNKKYWDAKIARNKMRDQAVNKFYKAKKWNVIRIWEHNVLKNSEKAILRLKNSLA